MMDFFLQHIDLALFLFLICLGYGAGTIAEKRHYTSIKKREKELVSIPVITAQWDLPDKQIKEAEMVSGSAVISIDYFKRLLAILRNIFGGRVSAYESLVDRARREAIIRMKKHASDRGATIVVNLRIETSAIGINANRKRQVGSVEAIAYGTAIVFTPS